MKILVLEDPEEHLNASSSTSRTIYPSIEESIKIEGGESELVKNLQQADLALHERRFEGVIIHHYGYQDVEYLRKKYPQMKFAAISAMILPAENCPLGSMAESFRSKLAKHYDFLLYDYNESIRAMIKSLQASR